MDKSHLQWVFNSAGLHQDVASLAMLTQLGNRQIIDYRFRGAMIALDRP